MEHAEIRYFTGYRDDNFQLVQGDQIIKPEFYDGPDAIDDGCQRCREIIAEERIARVLVHASIDLDFKNNMTVEITLRGDT